MRHQGHQGHQGGATGTIERLVTTRRGTIKAQVCWDGTVLWDTPALRITRPTPRRTMLDVRRLTLVDEQRDEQRGVEREREHPP